MLLLGIFMIFWAGREMVDAVTFDESVNSTITCSNQLKDFQSVNASELDEFCLDKLQKFKDYDTDNDGEMTLEEVQEVWYDPKEIKTVIKENVTDDELVAFVKLYFENADVKTKDGGISAEEFVLHYHATDGLFAKWATDKGFTFLPEHNKTMHERTPLEYFKGTYKSVFPWNVEELK